MRNLHRVEESIFRPVLPLSVPLLKDLDIRHLS